MNTRADKKQENKSRSGANAASRNRGSESAVQFFDNRPEAIAQRKLKETANNSSHVKHLKTIQETADNGLHLQKKVNKTGLRDNLKSGIENLSGFSMDDVRVHYNSSRPAQLNAHAYTQGTDIHLASGQEKHLPHEAWHVVQQKQGRVQPTAQLQGKVKLNNDVALEREADRMGAIAVRQNPTNFAKSFQTSAQKDQTPSTQLKCSACEEADSDLDLPILKQNCCGSVQRKPIDNFAGSGVVQMRECSDGVEWSTATPAHNAAALRLSGMIVSAEEAHILCCALCKAQIHSLTNAGGADPLTAIFRAARFTNLFDQYVPQEVAAAYLPATTTLRLEESYFIGANAANDRLLDNAWWTAIRVPINAGFFTGAGVYPAGLPPAAQAEFDRLQAFGPIIPPAPFLPVGRRSYRLLTVVLLSPIYEIARFLENNPAVGLMPAASAWGVLRANAGGHARSSDVTIDRAMGGGPSSILDAKFSYAGGGYDFFHGNQEPDLLRAHTALPGGGAGVGGLAPQHIAALTIGTCSCANYYIETQKRSKRRSETRKGPDQPASRTRGAAKRIAEQFEKQTETRKRLRHV